MNEHEDDEIVELGTASCETRGATTGPFCEPGILPLRYVGPYPGPCGR